MPSVGKFPAMRTPSGVSRLQCVYVTYCKLRCRHPAVEHGVIRYASLDLYDTHCMGVPIIRRCEVIRWPTKGKQSGVSILKLAWKLLFQYEVTTICRLLEIATDLYYMRLDNHKQKLEGSPTVFPGLGARESK